MQRSKKMCVHMGSLDIQYEQMFDKERTLVGPQHLIANRRMAAEEAALYAPAVRPEAAVALETINAGVHRLREVDFADCTDDDLGEALLALEQAQRLLAAQQARMLTAFDRRDAYRADACVSTGGWLRLKTNLGPGPIKRRTDRAELLQRMPQVAAAFSDGAIGAEHVDAIAYRATARRTADVAEADATLAELARHAEPRHVAVAVQRIVDAVDADGEPDPKPCEIEQLREISLREGIYDTGDLLGTTTPLLSELLRRTRDVYGPIDAADTPDEQRLTRGQRFHDALVRALTVALDAHPSTIDGVNVAANVFVDLATWLGHDELARIKPRLGSGKVIDAETARHLLRTSNPVLRLILGLGPWQPITVSRAMRTFPQWLSTALAIGMPTCAAPGCDVPFWQCDIDHRRPWELGGETALFNGQPLCRPHNNLKHQDGWSITFDSETGVVTWTSRDGTRVIDLPPPDL